MSLKISDLYASNPQAVAVGDIAEIARAGSSGAIDIGAELMLANGKMHNVGLSATVSGNALTIKLVQLDGATDPGPHNQRCLIAFRSATLASGAKVIREISAALSTIISSGSTAGFSNGVEGQLYIYAIDNAGTVELAWSGINTWDETALNSTTAEGGAGAADSGTVLYSTTARTNVAIRYLGRMKLTEVTAGTWVTLPSKITIGSDIEIDVNGVVKVFGSVTWPVMHKRTKIIVSSGSASTQDIATHGAASVGDEIWVSNIGAGLVSINWDGTGNVAQVPTNGVAGFIWSGTQWNLLTPVSGSNANGNWEKFPDRRMICSGGESSGTGVITVTFPIPFATSSYECALMVYNNGSTTELYTANAIFSAQTTTGMQYRKKYYIPGGIGGDAIQPSTWIVRGFY